MSSKDNNKGSKSKPTAANSGKQSTPLTEKQPSQIRLTIKEFTPEVAAEVSKKKEKTGGEASKESKPSSSSSSSSLLSSSNNHQQQSASSSPRILKSWMILSMQIMMRMKAD